MSQFEKYHPILTAHYAFDWLTKARSIDVLRLYQRADAAMTIQTAAEKINQTMREIFHDQKLVWGVTDRTDGHFVGQVGFDPIDTSTGQATVSVDVFADTPAAVLTEIYQRLVAFGTAELKLTTLTVTLTGPDSKCDQVLTALGFHTTDHQHYHYQK